MTVREQPGADPVASAVSRQLSRFFWLLPLAFYAATVSRTPGWVDAPLIAKIVYHVELSTWVNNHNLFTLVGAAWLHLLPESIDPHYALNLLCAGLGAATVYVVFRVGLRLTDNPFASALGAIVLMVSQSLWWHSTMLEVYTLSTWLLAMILLFVVRYEQKGTLLDLCVASLLFGLACSNHPQMGLVGFGFVTLLAFRENRQRLLRPKTALVVTLSFLLGFQLYLWVFATEFFAYLRSAPQAEPSVVLRVMLARTSGGDFRRYMFPEGLSIHDRLFWWAFYAGFFIYNFPLPWLVFAPIGALAWWRNKRARVSFCFLGITWLAQAIWSANYLVWDMYAFSLPVYVMTGILITVGVDWAYRRSRTLRLLLYALAPTVLLIPMLYRQAPRWLGDSPVAVRFLSNLPQYAQATAFWDPMRYFFDPNKRSYDRVERYSTIILSRLEAGACFWGSEATMLYPLQYYYQGVLREREDVSYHLVFGILGDEETFRRQAEALRAQLQEGRPVYVSSLGYPERNVLNHLYDQLDPTIGLQKVEQLSVEAFVRTFPRHWFDRIDVDPSERVGIYKLRPREQAVH